jgi:hypothetical protein
MPGIQIQNVVGACLTPIVVKLISLVDFQLIEKSEYYFPTVALYKKGTIDIKKMAILPIALDKFAVS